MIQRQPYGGLTHGDPFDPNSPLVEGPTVPREEWDARWVKLLGRELTATEATTIDRWLEHGWTWRAIAEEVFGEKFVCEFVDAGGLRKS